MKVKKPIVLVGNKFEHAIPPWGIDKPASKKPKKAAAKTEAKEPIADRVSVFGEKFLISTEEEWTNYEGIGWVHTSEEMVFQCKYSHCIATEKWYPAAEMLYAVNGCKIHSSVVKAGDWVKCPAKGRYYPKSAGQVVYNGSDGKEIIVSPEGKGEYYRKCSYDNRFYTADYMKRIYSSGTYDWVHYKHFNNPGAKFKTCPVCERHFEADMVKHHTEHNPPVMVGGYTEFCTNCHKKHAFHGLIQPHDFNGYPKPLHTKRTRLGSEIRDGLVCAVNKPVEIKDYRFFGVEVETEIAMNAAKRKGQTRHTLAHAVLTTLGNDFVITKEDGTLTLNGKYSNGEPGATYAGFEIVTAPADLSIHRERWPRMEKMEGYKLFRAWDTDTCGFHVHVSKASLTTLQIGKMLVFINHPNNKKLIQKIAGRSEKKFTRYIPKEPSDVLHPDRVCNPDESKPRDRARRVALNVSNEKTVEFRIFRGTVNARHILRNIEFCDAVCDFCYPASRSMREYSNPQAFIDYVDSKRKQWPLLAEWFGYWKMITVKEPGPKAKHELVTLKPSRVEEPEDKTDEGMGVAFSSVSIEGVGVPILNKPVGWATIGEPIKWEATMDVVAAAKKKIATLPNPFGDDESEEASDEDGDE